MRVSVRPFEFATGCRHEAFCLLLRVLSQNALQFFWLKTIVADVGGMGSVVAIQAYFLHIMFINELSTYMVEQC